MKPGERYLTSDIADKAQLIADLITDNERLSGLLKKMEGVLTPSQRKKLEAS